MKACPSNSTSVLSNLSALPTSQSSIPPMALASCKVLPKPLYPVYRSTSAPTGRLQQGSLSPGCWQIIIPKGYCTCQGLGQANRCCLDNSHTLVAILSCLPEQVWV